MEKIFMFREEDLVIVAPPNEFTTEDGLNVKVTSIPIEGLPIPLVKKIQIVFPDASAAKTAAGELVDSVYTGPEADRPDAYDLSVGGMKLRDLSENLFLSTERVDRLDFSKGVELTIEAEREGIPSYFGYRVMSFLIDKGWLHQFEFVGDPEIGFQKLLDRIKGTPGHERIIEIIRELLKKKKKEE